MGISQKGNPIRDARKAKGLTQKELALMLGCSNTTISKYEQGEIENMPRPRMKKLAEILQASPVVLFGFTPEDEKKEKPTANNELSEKKKALMDFAKAVPEEKAELVLKVIRSIVEDD